MGLIHNPVLAMTAVPEEEHANFRLDFNNKRTIFCVVLATANRRCAVRPATVLKIHTVANAL